MAPPVFPALPGLAWPVKRSPKWHNVNQDAISGKRVRVPLWTYPLYDFELPFKFLRSAQSYQEWQTLVGFINSLQGSAQLFAYDDVNDDTVSDREFGKGDGLSTTFQLVRTLGGFTEPVFLLNGTPTVAGAALTWSGSYYRPCRLDGEAFEITQSYQAIFAMKSLKFSREKLP